MEQLDDIMTINYYRALQVTCQWKKGIGKAWFVVVAYSALIRFGEALSRFRDASPW